MRFLAGGTTLVDLMKLDVETPDRLVDINRLPLDTIETTADGGLQDRRHRPQLAISPTTPSCGATMRCCRRPFSPAPRPSCATWRRPPATCCSGHAACTSATPPCPATSASPAPAAPRSTGSNRMLAILGTSEHCIATQSVRHVRRDGGARRDGSRARARVASAPSRSPTSTCCPATRRTGRPCSSPAISSLTSRCRRRSRRQHARSI